MKLRARRGIASNIILAVLVIAATSRCAGNARGRSQTLVIRGAGSHAIYGKWPLEDRSFEKRGEFAIEFIHSVNQTPVREFFRVEDGMIFPFAVRFYSFGAGMRSDLEEGQTFGRDGDAMIISGFFPARKELAYIVGTVSDHLLIINGKTISLRDLCGRNAHISIRAE